MELIEDVRGRDTSWLLSWAQRQSEYHDYLPYVLDELVVRSKTSSDVIVPLADILEAQVGFPDSRKPMPGGLALHRLFKEGPDTLRRKIVMKADGWSQEKQEDLIMFGLERDDRNREVSQWEAELGFTRKKTKAGSV